MTSAPAAMVQPTWSERLASWSVRRRYTVAVSALLLTAACAFPALDLVRLHVKTNIFSLLPKNHPSVRDLMAVIDKTGGWGDLMVVVQSEDPAANRRFAAELQASLQGVPWINFSEYRNDTAFLEKNALLLIARQDLDSIARRLRDRYEYEVSRRDPGFVELDDAPPPSVDFSDIEARYRRSAMLRPYHDSPDGKTLILAIYPKGVSGEVKESRRYVRDVSARIAAIDKRSFPASLRVRIGGTFMDRLEEYDSITRDLALSGVLMASLFVVLIFAHFRQAWTVPLVFLTFGMPLLWTFALARYVVAELNLITVFLVNVLSGLGIDFAIHMLTRYLDERAAGRPLHEALAVVTARSGRACWSAAFTTAVAFWTLLFTRFLGFRQFGIIAGFGLTFAFLSAYFVLPSLIAVAEDARWLRHVRSADLPLPLRLPAKGVLVSAALVAAVLGFAAAPRLVFEYDMTRLRTRLTPASQELRDTVRSVFAGARDPIIVWARDLGETAEVKEAVRRRIHEAGGENPVRAVFSVVDLVPPDQDARLAAIAEIRKTVDTLDEYAAPEEKARIAGFRGLLVDRTVVVDELPANLRWRFFGVPGSAGNLVYLLHQVPLTDTRRAAALVGEIRAMEGGKGWRVASDAVVVDDLLRIMKQDSVRAVTLSALAVFLVLWLDFRSLRRSGIAAIPLVVGVGWMLGLMWLFGIKLNFYNMVVFPSLLGIGVDSGIHVYHRFLEAPDQPVEHVLRATRGAVAMSALTTMISFGSMVVSVHRGLASLGLLALIGLAATLIAATVVFPLILERYRPACRR